MARLRNLGVLLCATASLAHAEPITIAALGDSLTQGYGLPVNEGFVPQLQQWLDAHGAQAQVVNAGVSGDTTAGGLSRVGWTLTPEVDAMIVALGGNDFLRGIDPAASRENLRGILQVASDQGIAVLLVGLKVAANYGPDYQAAFEGMYPALAAEYDAVFFPTFFEGLVANGGTAQARASYMQPDGLHPNAEGVALIVAAMGPAVLDLVARAQ